jgi:hypothetical protein
MRQSAFLLAMALLAASPAAAQSVIHHDAKLRLDPQARTVQVTDRLRVENMTALAFPLGGAAPARIGSVTVDDRPAELRGEGGQWRLPLGPGKWHDVAISYTLTLRPFPKEPNGRDADLAAAGPEGMYLPAGAAWLIDSAEQHTYRLTVEAPNPYVAVATGTLSAEDRGEAGYRAVFASERPGEPPAVFAGRYAVTERMHGTLRLRAYFDGGLSETLAQDYLGVAEKTIDAFTQRIGPYPYDNFSIVAAPLPVGLALPGLTYVGSKVLPLPFVRSQSLPHEILHNWWGNGVYPDVETGNWSEGLTTFMADYGLADADTQRRMRMDWLRDFSALPPEREQALTAFRFKEHEAAQVIGYNKAAFLFIMLQDELGPEAFAAGLRGFWEHHRFTRASWQDLRRSFEAASGRDLMTFFAQWVERSGAPTLRLDKARPVLRSIDWQVRLDVTQDGEPYELLVPVAVEAEKGREDARLRVEGATSSAGVPVSGKPHAVALDPDYRLFRHLLPGESPASLRDVTLAQAPAVVIAADGPAAQAARQLAERLVETGPRPVTLAEAADKPGPLLLIGTAEPVAAALARLLPSGPPPGAPSGGSAVAWVVAERPKGGPLMVVVARDAEALAALLRPLPHYGRESWLVFDGARMVQRGRWPVSDSPLRRSLESPKP